MNSQGPITTEWTLNRRRRPKEPPTADVPEERIPRLARLMALAIRFDGLIRQGVVRDYADLARLGHVSRARLTQIMNLLAPDIQEELLDLRQNQPGRTSPCERHTRKIARLIYCPEQRRLWQKIVAECGVRKMQDWRQRQPDPPGSGDGCRHIITDRT